MQMDVQRARTDLCSRAQTDQPVNAGAACAISSACAIRNEGVVDGAEEDDKLEQKGRPTKDPKQLVACIRLKTHIAFATITKKGRVRACVHDCIVCALRTM